MGIQYLFSLFYDRIRWQETLYDPVGFIDLYQSMFPGIWERASKVEPLLPAELAQPDLELPFNEGERWSLTGGPHYSWNAGSPRGALDFAPVTGEPACAVSKSWVTAMAPGLVARSAYNVLVIDLDGDGFEETGWSWHIHHRSLTKSLLLNRFYSAPTASLSSSPAAWRSSSALSIRSHGKSKSSRPKCP